MAHLTPTILAKDVAVDNMYHLYIKCRLSNNVDSDMSSNPCCDDCGKLGSILLHFTNFRSPCKCCGSPDHALLIHTQMTDNEETYEAAQVRCPSVWTTCISKILQEDRMSMKNRPCPEKFAEAHNYDIIQAKLALKKCYTYGSGWHMYPQQFESLSNEVSQICYNAHNPTFTRDVSHLQDTEESEEYDEHTDTESPLDLSLEESNGKCNC